jgi:multidrug efflux pump subunit AcrB
MPITWTTDSASISTTEYSIVADSTSLATDTNQGIYHIKVGLENMVAGDQYSLKLYEKAASGATKRVQEEWTFTGVSKDFRESSSGLYFAFLLALALIYLALAAQFESFLDPLIIMITVPLALVGALWALNIFDHTLNIFSQIGIIVLVGIVTKNGILIVEFANQKMEEGMDATSAAIFAATQRMRPILMTSIATVLGVLPIAVAFGAAATSRIPMGVAIIGGLVFSLVLTLFVIPAIYTFFNRQHKKELTA